ncbi:MAG: arsenate reductase family protein [Candidatus Limnocylindrales bacterium]
MPADPRPGVQVFGRRDSRDTQKALRFFRERRIPVHFVDVAIRPPAAGELRRFADRLGATALLDRDGRRYRDLGLAYLRVTESELFDRLVADPALLRLPLVRNGPACTVGPAEAIWIGWLRAAAPGETRG